MNLSDLRNIVDSAYGKDWTGLVEAVRPGTEAQAIQMGLSQITGVKPHIYDVGNRWVVMFDDVQAAQVRGWIDSKVFSTVGGREGAGSVQEEPVANVRSTEVKLGNVIGPYLLGRAVPAALALVAVGYLIGRSAERSKKPGKAGF